MKMVLTVPKQYASLVEDLRLLKRDNQNPNVMSKKQKERTWSSLKKYGWVYPIVTNKDGLLADGEQRVDVCIDHKEFNGPVLRLPIRDVDRRLLRQVLNKLRGQHDKLLDAQEFQRIIDLDHKADLKHLLALSDDNLKQYMLLLEGEEKTLRINELFEVVVTCENEAKQEETFNKLKELGYSCRVLIL